MADQFILQEYAVPDYERESEKKWQEDTKAQKEFLPRILRKAREAFIESKERIGGDAEIYGAANDWDDLLRDAAGDEPEPREMYNGFSRIGNPSSRETIIAKVKGRIRAVDDADKTAAYAVEEYGSMKECIGKGNASLFLQEELEFLDEEKEGHLREINRLLEKKGEIDEKIGNEDRDISIENDGHTETISDEQLYDGVEAMLDQMESGTDNDTGDE